MNEIQKFLDEYNIVDIPEYNQNFFEIAGFPRYEIYKRKRSEI